MTSSATLARPQSANLNFVLICVFIDMLGIGLIVPVLPALVGEFVAGREQLRHVGGDPGAASGAGVAIGIRAFVDADLAAGRLVQPVRHIRRSHSGFNMFYSSSKVNRKPRVRSVLEWMRNERARAH